MKSTFLALAFAVTACQIAQAAPPSAGGRLVAINPTADTLLAIDPNTFVVSTIGPLGVDYEFGGLAYDPNLQILYMRSRGSLYTVDPFTGHATYKGYDPTQREGYGLAFDSNRNQL